MENVYNHTSGIIKDLTVHRINVCESHSRPCTDAETRHCGDPEDLSQPKNAGDCQLARYARLPEKGRSGSAACRGGREHWQYGFHCISVGKHGAEKPVGIGGSKQC